MSKTAAKHGAFRTRAFTGAAAYAACVASSSAAGPVETLFCTAIDTALTTCSSAWTRSVEDST
jgi:phage tail sheath gpL-like